MNQDISHNSEPDSHKNTTEESSSTPQADEEESDQPLPRKTKKMTKRVRIASRIITSDDEAPDHAVKAEEDELQKPAEEIIRAATLPQEPDLEPQEDASVPKEEDAPVQEEEDASPMEHDQPPETEAPEVEAPEADETPEVLETTEVPEEERLNQPYEQSEDEAEHAMEDMAGYTSEQEVNAPDEQIDPEPMEEDDKPVEPEPIQPIPTADKDFKEDESFPETPAPETPKNKTPVPGSIVKPKPAFIPEVEEPGGVPMDPATPVRTAASRLDADDWEDEDRRESGHSQVSSPVLSPSQWVDLTSSTPKSRKTPIQLGHTPRQRFKDMVGSSPARTPIRRGPQFPQLVSPALKRKVKPSMSPEAKQNRLIDRLENLMHDNANMEVLAVAEQAVKEEAKLLKRSQTRERRAEASKNQQDLGESTVAPGSPEHTNIFLQGSSVMKTPIKKSSSSMDHESPETPIRTPLPISKVISAIGAASRRANTNASPVPFVRTPVRKATQALRLEDLEVRRTSDDKKTTTSDHDKSDLAKARDYSKAASSSEDKRSRGSQSVSHPASSSSSTAMVPKRLSYGKEVKEVKDVKDIKDIRDTKDEVMSERARLMKEANITEEELKMTVEDFHRAFVTKEILELELASESWVLKFEEESNRVRMALLEGSDF